MSNQTSGGSNVKVTITEDDRVASNWVKGIATGGFKFTAKIFDEGSIYGIKKGRVSKLDIRKDGKILANYDRGWDVRPKVPEVKAVYEAVLKSLNALGKEADIGSERKDFLGAVKANEDKVSRKQTYAVTIFETLKKTVEVEAASSEEAKGIVNNAWQNSEHVLGPDDFMGMELDARRVKRDLSKHKEDEL